ncbi:hypothetical protein GWI33_013032, partial [Rhynchophorus ferrugineus]
PLVSRTRTPVYLTSVSSLSPHFSAYRPSPPYLEPPPAAASSSATASRSPFYPLDPGGIGRGGGGEERKVGGRFVDLTAIHPSAPLLCPVAPSSVSLPSSSFETVGLTPSLPPGGPPSPSRRPNNV